MLIFWNAEGVHGKRKVGNPCARELLKGSNGSASHLVCTQKKFLWLGVVDFRPKYLADVFIGN